jgi:pantetheine-phosphate adenylyltransferase
MKRAIFAGTFDPVTNGHLDLLERALELFDGVVVAVAEGHHKQTLFSLDERVSLFKESTAHFNGIEVVGFHGLLVEFARSHGVRILIRGLRMVSDFEYEYQMALMNRKLDRKLETVFLMPSARYAFLNATVIKEIGRHGGDLTGLVPEPVLRRFRERWPSPGCS